MTKKRILSFMLLIIMLITALPVCASSETETAAAYEEKARRTVYLHGQGENPTTTTNVSEAYLGEVKDIYLAVDNPNKGESYSERAYDMNGYAVKIYFDGEFFDYTDEIYEQNRTSCPIQFLPEDMAESYHYYLPGNGTEEVRGKTYKTAYAVVFFGQGYLPDEENDPDGTRWYNLLRLPLMPKKIGNTEVFIEYNTPNTPELPEGYNPEFDPEIPWVQPLDFNLELYAKDVDENFSSAFLTEAHNAGRHRILISERGKPQYPVPEPAPGSYSVSDINIKNGVTLKVLDSHGNVDTDCEIWLTDTEGGEYKKYTGPIPVQRTKTIWCKSFKGGKWSDSVSYTYSIIPDKPLLYYEDADGKKLIEQNTYSAVGAYRVYASDKSPYGAVDADTTIYYTYTNISEQNLTEASDPEEGWVKMSGEHIIDVTERRTVRLIAYKYGEWSAVNWYYLGIRPAPPAATPGTGKYSGPQAVELTTSPENAVIYYTTDGKDPRSADATKYTPGCLTVYHDTTLRAVSLLDGQYSDVVTYYYSFDINDNRGVDAFYPPGEYEEYVDVTLRPYNPENDVYYSLDGGDTWHNQKETPIPRIEVSTEILAKAVKGDEEGSVYVFKYEIIIKPPEFVPESRYFTSPDIVSVFAPESDADNHERYDLYYTFDITKPLSEWIHAVDEEDTDTAGISVTDSYTVISAVVIRDRGTDKEMRSEIVTHSYDVILKKPAMPEVTLDEGNYYIRKTDDEEGYFTQFLPVPTGTEIWYTLDGSEPVPNGENSIKYNFNDETAKNIPVKGRTVIKAVAVNRENIRSDVRIAQYTVTPEAPKMAPSSEINLERLPVLPVETVKESTVTYTVGSFTNVIHPNEHEGVFYIDTSTGNAYKDKEKAHPIGNSSPYDNLTDTDIDIHATLDGIDSLFARYSYSLSDNPETLAAPYASKLGGEYDEIDIDGENSLLILEFFSLNEGDEILYMTDSSGQWLPYVKGTQIKLTDDTSFHLKSVKEVGGKTIESAIVNYVYEFVPLPPIITLPSGVYGKNPIPVTVIDLDEQAPDKDYKLYYRENGNLQFSSITPGTQRQVKKTMFFRAYVKNEHGKKSEDTVRYYIIEDDSTQSGEVFCRAPYNVKRLSADVLAEEPYNDGIKLGPIGKTINYRYTITKNDAQESTVTSDDAVFKETMPIIVNSSMKGIEITAWITGENGEILDEGVFPIEFVHLGVPSTELEGKGTIEFEENRPFKLCKGEADENTYGDDVFIWYTTDNTNPADPENEARQLYKEGDLLYVSKNMTVKAVYFSACGECSACAEGRMSECVSVNGVYGKVGTYHYTVPTVQRVSSGGGGGGGTVTVDKTRKYTKDIFGNEHPTHISYIKGYPDGSVRPDGAITREEVTVILYRITNHEYEEPFVITGEVFPDVLKERWSVKEIEYMSGSDVVLGYPDGEFKPERSLTRAEFAALIARFTGLESSDDENTFSDLEEEHWAYGYITALVESGLMEGYPDGTYGPEREITRAEVMTVINKILGRTPLASYVTSLEFYPFNDLKKDKWYYVAVMEATVTHNYYLNDSGYEYKWEDWK